MKTRHFLMILALAALCVPLFAATPCPPSSPWPPAAGPIVKAVPWVVPQLPLCSITPHDAVSGVVTYLKATTDSSATMYFWDYGDGSPAMSWTAVSDPYNIGVQHTYTGSIGQSFTATISVKDAASHINTAKYYLQIRDGSDLGVKVNLAIDQALWRMHREMRARSGAGDAMVGYWNGGAYTGSGYTSNYGANTTAFLVKGHKPDSDPTNPNPYAETALRGLNVTLLGVSSLSIPSSVTNAHGTFNPDGNGNSNALYVSVSGQPIYESGMVMDMLAATGMPAFVAQVGGPNINGKPLSTILQDMMDFYTYCQNVNSGGYTGGWRYTCRSGDSDNSTSQWGAIGILGAVNEFGLKIPPPIPGPGTSPVILANIDWLTYDHDGHGFGYTSAGYYPWGPWAVTPSGMVQLVMDGIGRGAPGGPKNMWDHVEDYVRTNFSGPLSYYYGLFSFTKSMLQYPGGELTQLCNHDATNNLTNCIDWYAADTAKGDPINGVAKTLVSTQAADGYWWGHNQSGAQYYYETAWATIMLNKTVFTGGLPVAVIDATPGTVINGGMVNLVGKNSFHQDPNKHIVKWEWDVSGTGSGPFTLVGTPQNNVVVSTLLSTFPVSFPIRLRVTDDSTPTPLTAIATVSITITNPPFPPTANAGGPYSICPQAAYLPFYLNGTGSKAAPGHLAGTTNPDNFITLYEWDLDGNGSYDLSGGNAAQPRADDFYSSHGLLGSGSTVLAGLRVTDNSMISFGTTANLQGAATAQVFLRTAADPLCSHCVTVGQAILHPAVPGKATYVSLVWTETGAHHYNVYRGTVDGGPYTLIGKVANTIMGSGKSMGYSDTSGNFVLGAKYYYRFAPATAADIETCQSNQANAVVTITKIR
jgi:hypothetical protein